MLEKRNICIFVLSFNILLLESIDIGMYYLCSIHLWSSSVSSVLFALHFLCLISFPWCTIYCLYSFIIDDKFIFYRKQLTSKFQALLLFFGRGKEQTQLIAYKKKNLPFLNFWRFYQFANICGIICPWRIFIEFFKLHPAANRKMPIWHFFMPSCWAWQNFM